jgi:hypothetical protein
MNIILDSQAKRLADKDRIPLDTIGAYTDTCGTSYYWIHTMINQKLVFDFDQCNSVEEGLKKAKQQWSTTK